MESIIEREAKYNRFAHAPVESCFSFSRSVATYTSIVSYLAIY